MNYAPVAALLKGLKVLEAVNALGPASLRQIQEATDLPKATTLRLLETLCYAGYLSVSPETHRYVVTARVLALSNNYQPNEALWSVARPIMESLRGKTGWPSDLAIYQHGKMVISDTNRQPGTLSVNRSVGSRVPVTKTALGRAYLAFCPDAEREDIISFLKESGDQEEELAHDPDWLAGLVEQVRAQGYATSNQELVKTIRAVAVPVKQDEAVICTFNLIVTAQAVSFKELKQKYVPLLQSAAQEMTSRVSGQSANENAETRKLSSP